MYVNPWLIFAYIYKCIYIYIYKYMCNMVYIFVCLYYYTREKWRETLKWGENYKKKKKKKMTSYHKPLPSPVLSFFALYLFIFTFILLRWLSNLGTGTGKVKAQKWLHTLHVSIIYTEMKYLKVLINFSLCFFFKWFFKFEDPLW